MSGTLRERLLELVAEWREDARADGVLIYPPEARAVSAGHARRLSTILAESEGPKRCRQCDGILSTPTCGLCAGQTHYVGDDCPGGHAEVGEMLPIPNFPGSCGKHDRGAWLANCPDCEAKAKLPLGHPFRAHSDGSLTLRCQHITGYEWLCGQPRSAHEPPTKPTL